MIVFLAEFLVSQKLSTIEKLLSGKEHARRWLKNSLTLGSIPLVETYFVRFFFLIPLACALWVLLWAQVFFCCCVLNRKDVRHHVVSNREKIRSGPPRRFSRESRSRVPCLRPCQQGVLAMAAMTGVDEPTSLPPDNALICAVCGVSWQNRSTAFRLASPHEAAPSQRFPLDLPYLDHGSNTVSTLRSAPRKQCKLSVRADKGQSNNYQTDFSKEKPWYLSYS